MKHIKHIILITLIMVSSSGKILAQQSISGKSNTVEVNFSGERGTSDKDKSSIEIHWIKPEIDKQEISKNKYTIEVGVNAPSGVMQLDFLLNYSSVDDTRGFQKKDVRADDGFDSRFTRRVNLPVGMNTISVAVETENGKRATAHRKIKYNKEDAMVNSIKNRTDHALIFATNKYDSWSNLSNPVFDAKTIAEELKKYYGFEVETVFNADYKEVLSKIKEYAEKDFGKKDQLFVFFAGHGHFDKSYKEGYIVCSNSEKNDETKSTYIAHSNIRTYVGNIPCNHILLTMDVCFGGTFDQSIAQGGSRGMEMYNEVSNIEYIKRKLDYKTRKYITSGGKEYVPDGRPGHHSPFAKKIIEALRNYGGRDGILTLTELKSYLERVKPQPRAGSFGQNEPGSDFIFVADKK